MLNRLKDNLVACATIGFIVGLLGTVVAFKFGAMWVRYGICRDGDYSVASCVVSLMF